MNHLHPLNEERNRPRPSQNIAVSLLPVERDKGTPDRTMQASFINSTITEEDFIDNEQPNLALSISTDSFSSHMNSNDDMDEPDWDSFPMEDRSDTPKVGPTFGPSDSKNEHHIKPLELLLRTRRPKPKLSLSMHDISTIPTYPLTSKFTNFSTSTIQSQSMTTDASLPKSKDSGLPRSLSCFSLNSNKNYAHVQSKVKEYIKQIKEENGTKRKLVYKECSNATSCQTEPEFSSDESCSVKALIPIIDQLKDALEDKDKMLYKLQEDYDKLLIRYAASENRVDHLRLNSGDAGNYSPFNFDKSDYKKPKASPNMLLLPELENIQRESLKKHNSQTSKNTRSKAPKQESNTKSNAVVTFLSPVTKLCSSSIRLDKIDLLPLTSSEGDGSFRTTNDNRASCTSSWPYRMDKNFSGRCPTGTSLDKSEFGIRVEEKTPLANKELSPERLNHQIAENPFSKVKRWQESLPSFELIEPSSYENVTCHNRSEILSASQVKKPVDQCFADSCDNISFIEESHLDSTKDELCKITNSSSHSTIYSRSVSQPNNLLGDLAQSTNNTNNTNKLKSWLSQSSAQSSTSLEYDLDQHLIPTFNPDGLSLPVQGSSYLPNKCTKPLQLPLLLQKSQTCPSINQTLIPGNRPRNLGLTESSHLRRKKLLGQKARLILSEYLKNSNSKPNSFNYPITKSESIFTLSDRTKHFFQLTEGSKHDRIDRYDNRDDSLVQCLDEMNQCAQNLKGKSEAIVQNVTKQLKDS